MADDTKPAKSIRVILSKAEMLEVERYTARHGSKKGTAARKALLDKVRIDNEMHGGEA